MDYLITYGIAILLLVLCIWWNWDVVKLNSHSLHLQWLFWIAVIFPILSCVYFGSIIWYEYPLEVSKNGYNSFLEISKLPLYLLAGSPILGAFVASAHRSYQTDIQIKTAKEQLVEAQRKNKVDIYLARRKYIIERLQSLTLEKVKKIEDANYFYDSFYKFCDYTDELNIEQYNCIRENIESIRERIDVFIKFNRSNKNELTLPYTFKKAKTELTGLFSSLLKYTKIELIEGIDLNKILKKFNEDYKKYSENKHQDISMKRNEFESMTAFFIIDLTYDLNIIEKSLREIFTVLLLDKDVDNYLPNLHKLRIITGDELAAENQNPPE
ncbi:MAG: hypothetical protein LBE28_10980 [Providencia alcalifaciens]|jgi:hypothetical protein|nr:hypothetical protein [Providencia alcalifaciens]